MVGVCCPSIQLPAQLCKAPMFIVCAGKLRENHLPSCVSTFKQGAQTDRQRDEETKRPKRCRRCPPNSWCPCRCRCQRLLLSNRGTDRQNESQMWLKYFQVIYLSTSLKFSTSMELRDVVAFQIHAESTHAQLDLFGSKAMAKYSIFFMGRAD